MSSNLSSLSAETARRDRIQSEPGARKSADSAPAGKPGAFAGLMQQAQAAQAVQGTSPADGARPAMNARHGVNPTRSNAAPTSSPDAALGTDEPSAEPTLDERTATQRRAQTPGARSKAASPGTDPGTDETDAANPPEKPAAHRMSTDGTEAGASLPPWLQPLSALRAKTGAAPTAGAETAGRSATDEGGRGSARDAIAGLGATDKAAGVRADSAPQDTSSALTAGMTPVESAVGSPPAGTDFASTLQSMTAGASANPTQAAPAAAAPVDVPIPVPVHDPEFGAHVMMRAGDLAQSGVTEAQLHLNPADMGPIRIHIAMDGQKAQINFEASHAETRALLEAALPALAQSLQDDGLQLERSSVVQVVDLPAEPPTLGAGSQGPGGQQGRQDGGQPWRDMPGRATAAAQRGVREAPEGRDALAPLPRAGWGHGRARHGLARAGSLRLSHGTCQGISARGAALTQVSGRFTALFHVLAGRANLNNPVCRNRLVPEPRWPEGRPD